MAQSGSGESVGISLGRVWRGLMAGCCFAIFGLGGLFLSTIWFNLLLLVIRDDEKRRNIARNSISLSFRFFLKVTQLLGVLDYSYEGLEKLAGDRACLMIANHPSLLDYVFITARMPGCDCLVKAGLLANPFMSGVIRSADYLLNSESDTLLEACQTRLGRGDNILIFPEGTRTRVNQPLQLQRGAANIAVRCGCDLRVVHIYCTEAFLTKGEKWYQAPPRKPVFTIKIEDRIQVADFVDHQDLSPALAARRLTRHLTEVLTLTG